MAKMMKWNGFYYECTIPEYVIKAGVDAVFGYGQYLAYMEKVKEKYEIEEDEERGKISWGK